MLCLLVLTKQLRNYVALCARSCENLLHAMMILVIASMADLAFAFVPFETVSSVLLKELRNC